MKKVLFASYDCDDISTILPVFPVLRDRGFDFMVLNGYPNPATANQIKNVRVVHPPDVKPMSRLSDREIKSLLSPFLDTEAVQHLIPLFRDGIEESAKSFLGLSSYYFDFALESIRIYDPDLIVLAAGEVGTSLVAKACEYLSQNYAFLLPQYYEFNFKGWFEVERDKDSIYMVAGEYGRSRLIQKGVSPGRVVVTGNPKFDPLFVLKMNTQKRAHAPAGRFKNILYTMQDQHENNELFDLLCRYVSKRKNVQLMARPHPNTPAPALKRFKRYGNGKRTSVTTRGMLEELMLSADVLVTISSMTILEALILGLPAISFKTSFLPEEVPFYTEVDVLRACNYNELETLLDRLLFNTDFRQSWIKDHRESYIKYTGDSDGSAALRVAEAIEKIIDKEYVDSGRQARSLEFKRQYSSGIK